MTESDPEGTKRDWIDRRTMLKGAVTAGFFGATGLASADSWREIRFASASGGALEYRLEVTGKAKRGGSYESDEDDEVGSNTIHGKCAEGRSDSFLVTGKITDLQLNGSGKALLDGEVVADTAGGGSASNSDSRYAVVQGDTCVPVQPITGGASVEMFYEYHLPQQYATENNGAVDGNSAAYASAGTADLQRARTSIAFLYRGPDGLSLVFVHGSVDAPDGGSVTFRLSGLPSSGSWVVKDDLYSNDTNYDRWSVGGTEHRVDWTWGSGGTDGGAFLGLGGDFDVVVHPAFNESATLYGEYYDGTVTGWEFVSGGSKRVSLDLDQPIRIRTGSCGGN